MKFYITQTKCPNYWFYPSIGLSSGIALTWKNGVDLETMHTTSDTIHTIVHTHDSKPDLLISFMYGAHNSVDFDNQWQYLLNMNNYVDLPWVLIGDLNFTMNDPETHNTTNHPHHSSHVRNFVQQLGLIDLGYSGHKSTWYNHRDGDAHVFVRLDRALVNTRWLNNYTNSHLQLLIPIASDHSPILLHITPSYSKHSPFKLYKCWFRVPSCTETINKSWQLKFLGSPSYQLSSKLKFTRTELHKWKRFSFGNIEASIHNVQNQIQQCSNNSLAPSHPEVLQLSNSLQTWLTIQKEYFIQQAGDKFLEVDKNTYYFHSLANFNKRRSNVHAIKGPLGIWYDSRIEIEEIMLSHFQNVTATSKSPIFQDILNLFQPCISDSDNLRLILLPDDQEIKDVVFSIRPWASPGNDGFQAAFYQQCWDTISFEVISMVQHFFIHKHMLKAINHTYQVLIPKTHHPQTPADYRPISLCNVSYKIISKNLANRLKPFLPNIISPTQTAFVSGRHIHDNAVIAHELLHTMKTKNINQALIGLKLDLSKAFDMVEWSFLISILRQLGFHSDWIYMIKQCVSTTNISLLINGSPSASFTPTRGIRQGDPLSPYLFLFVMEAFSRLLQHSVVSDQLQGLRINKHFPAIHHLFFADDCLLLF